MAAVSRTQGYEQRQGQARRGGQDIGPQRVLSGQLGWLAPGVKSAAYGSGYPTAGQSAHDFGFNNPDAGIMQIIMNALAGY